MTGYSIKKALADELILGQPKFSAIMIITIIGVVFIALAVLAKYRLINPPASFFNLFLGMGIIFTAGSAVFMIQKSPESIAFNKKDSMIVFTENNRKYSIPFSNYSRLIITGKISHQENSKTITYRLELISLTGAALLISESDDKAALQKTAETIISYMDIDLLSGSEILHDSKKNYSGNRPVYPPVSATAIVKASAGDKSVYTWNSRRSFVSLLLLGAVIFGFNFLFFNWAFPAMGKFNVGVYAGGAVLFLTDIFFAATFLFNLFGSNIAEISDSEFSYRQKIFGFSMNSRSFPRDEIAMITAGFTSDENKITVFTKRGSDIFNELKISAALNSFKDKSDMLSLLSKVMEMRSNIIEIDGTPLYFYEKLFLADEWSSILRLKGYDNRVN